MADRKITDLTALAAGSQATGDLLTIVDVSEGAAADKNKKITVESLFKGIPGNVGINTASPAGQFGVDGAAFFGNQSSSGTTDGVLRIVESTSSVYLQTGTNTSTGSSAALVFSDINASNEWMRINSSGNIGVGTNTPSAKLELRDNTQALLSWGNTAAIGSLSFDGSSQPVVRALSGKSLVFQTNGGNERMRIDSSGRLVVGASSGVQVAGSQSFIQHHGNKTTSNLALVGYANNLGGPILSFGASRSTTVGSPGTIVSSGDFLGDIRFAGDDGTDINSVAASIRGEVDGTPGSNDMPGRLVFNTTADGSSSATERARIDSKGRVLINSTAAATDNSFLTVQNSSGACEVNIMSGPSGASVINLGDTGDYNIGRIKYDQSTNSLQFNTNNSEAMRLDSSGRLLVGTTSNTSAYFTVTDGAQVTGAALNGNNNCATLDYYSSTARLLGHDGTNGGNIAFFTNAAGAGLSERVRINNAGRVLMNCTATSDSGILQLRNTVGSAHCLGLGTSSSSADTLVVMRHNTNANGSGGTTVGSITCNSTSTTYGTSSDYRLKENVVNLAGAIDRVKQLAPKRFNFIVDPNKVVDGFLAHEAQAVVPEAVYGTHNEVDDDGNAVMQLIDQSKLVPLLTAALQEAIAEIETLKTKVAALEAG